MVKNDRMRMTRAASTLPVRLPCLLIALLLGAAGLSAFAQAPQAAQAPAPAASDAVERHAVAKPVPPATFATPPATWVELTPVQRTLLAPLANDWASISVSQRSKWLSSTPMLATLPAAELARLHERMRDWARLTPAERLNARIGFQVAKQVDADQRQAKWEAYQSLPPEKRQALNDKAVARRHALASAPGLSPKPLLATGPKSNIVPAPPKLVSPTPVTGSLVQAKPGATTVLITRGTVLPSHHAAGETKVVADPALVDPKTLLPRSLKTPLASNPGS